MFIRVAGRLTKFSEEVVVFGVRDYMNGYIAVQLKPLRPFPPVSEMNMREHAPAVSATPVAGRLIV